MATSSKEEKIFIGNDEEIIELKGKEKEAFILQRELDQKELLLLRNAQEEQKVLKVSAYTKLGLTEEEINAIL